MAVNISKTNLAISSRPVARVTFSKVNLAVASHPPGRVVFSKTNIAFGSRYVVPSPRRPIWVQAVCGPITTYSPEALSLNNVPIYVDGDTVEFN